MTISLTPTQRMTGELNDIQRVRCGYSDATAWERSKLTGERKTVVAWVDGRYLATYEGAPYWTAVELFDGSAVMKRASIGGAQ